MFYLNFYDNVISRHVIYNSSLALLLREMKMLRNWRACHEKWNFNDLKFLFTLVLSAPFDRRNEIYMSMYLPLLLQDETTYTINKNYSFP